MGGGEIDRFAVSQAETDWGLMLTFFQRARRKAWRIDEAVHALSEESPAVTFVAQERPNKS